MAEPDPGELSVTIILEGQATVGFCVSTTVTVNVQLGPDATEDVTVVMPMGKKVPEAGVVVTVPQTPVVVGAG